MKKKTQSRYSAALAGVVESRTVQPPPAVTNGNTAADTASEGKKGKSNKDLKDKYLQTSVWVDRIVYANVKRELISPLGQKDFSTLVGELLSEWLDKRGKERS